MRPSAGQEDAGGREAADRQAFDRCAAGDELKTSGGGAGKTQETSWILITALLAWVGNWVFALAPAWL